MKVRYLTIFLFALIFCGCLSKQSGSGQSISIISWGGIPADKADTLYALARDCGFDMHLGLYRAKESAVASMDAAARKGIDVIISFPQIKDSTELAVNLIKAHPALFAYHLKDEPDTSDFDWLESLSDKIGELDPSHPCYINLLPNWAWGVEEYADKIESYASRIDVPFYSFDNYPIIEADGHIQVRPDWYRNLDEFSRMARRHGKPFWGFALAKAHSISDPWPDTIYPEPTLGHIRLQVFSNLLYGAQAIQYFNFTGLVDPVTCEKLPAYELVRQVNSEIKAYSSVFSGCKVLGVWHTGESTPSHTDRLHHMPHKKMKSLEMSGEGAVVSLIENQGQIYLAVQNRDCTDQSVLDISFYSQVYRILPDKEEYGDYSSIAVEPGNVVIFRL